MASQAIASQTVKDTEEMDDLDLAFDKIVYAEERYQEAGFNEGYSDGKLKGLQEGQKLGKQKAQEIASEIGFYQGFITTWRMILQRDESTSNSRKLKVLESVHTLLEQFPLNDVHCKNFFEDLNKIRAKFKQVCSLLNVTLKFEGEPRKDKPVLSF
ncbi:protein LTO1 homolog [Glandiceps talaboti]